MKTMSLIIVNEYGEKQDDYGSGLSKAYLVLEAKISRSETWRRRGKQYALKLMNREEQ